MNVRLQIAKHPLHPMLAPLPIVAVAFVLVADVMYAFTASGRGSMVAERARRGRRARAPDAAHPRRRLFRAQHEPARRAPAAVQLMVNVWSSASSGSALSCAATAFPPISFRPPR
jgi:uncharacterized membrane protein